MPSFWDQFDQMQRPPAPTGPTRTKSQPGVPPGTPGLPEGDIDFESLLREALGVARQEYGANAPLRERARDFLSGPIPAPRNLSDMFADPDNPYARQVPRPPRGPGAGLPAPAPPASSPILDGVAQGLNPRPQNPAPAPTPPAYPTPPRRRTLL